MRYIVVLFLVLFASCSSDDNDNFIDNPCKLTKVRAGALYYEYVEVENFISFSTEFNEINFEYDSNGRINKVTGGPIPTASGSNLSSWIFVNIPIYNITYQNNTVTLDSNIESVDGDNVNEYVIENEKVISRSVVSKYNFFINLLTNYDYEYFDNYIEEYRNDELFRTLYFENENLVKIEELKYFNFENPSEDPNTLIGKTEYIFSEFDNTTNLLKGLFYIDGAFYKAFSQNNFQKITQNNYNYIDGEFIIDSGGYRSFNFGVNEDGSNGMFTQICD